MYPPIAMMYSVDASSDLMTQLEWTTAALIQSNLLSNGFKVVEDKNLYESLCFNGVYAT